MTAAAATRASVTAAAATRASVTAAAATGERDCGGRDPGGRATAGCGAGWVRRWTASASVPATLSAAATMIPAAGNTSVASSVTSAGPITKIISSATDSSAYAVGRPPARASRVLHRARTMEPSPGMVAPAAPPLASSAQAGARTCAQSTKAAAATANRNAWGIRTRSWPSRSVSRAASGVQTAEPTAPAAATRPARPYRPVAAAISSTVPSPIIEIGIRPTNAAAENRSAPGRRSRAR